MSMTWYQIQLYKRVVAHKKIKIKTKISLLEVMTLKLFEGLQISQK